MKSFQYGGVWWDPREPGKKRVGTLHFDPVEGATLQLIVPADKPDLFPELASYEVLHGLTTGTQPITLIRAHDQSSKGTLGKAPRPLEVFANQVIVGAHCEMADPLVSSASATYRHLNEWYGRPGIRAEQGGQPTDITARYAAPAPVVLHDDGRFKISMMSRLSGGVGGHRAQLRERIVLEIQASSPAPLSVFRRLVHACGDFLSIACFALCDIRTLLVKFPVREGGRSESATFHAVPVYKRARRTWRGARMLFRYRDIEGREAAIFGAWLAQLERLESARALYFSGVYGGGFVETKLLALAQAAEAFHRRFHPPGVYMDPIAFESEVLASLTDAIPAEISASFRQSLLARLTFANEYSLRRRMNELVDEHVDALTALVKKPRAWVSPIVDHRNQFTHFPESAAEASATLGEQQEPRDPDRVLRYNFFLRVLLEACFLKAMGFNGEEIGGFANRFQTYRQLSERFFQPSGDEDAA